MNLDLELIMKRKAMYMLKVLVEVVVAVVAAAVVAVVHQERPM